LISDASKPQGFADDEAGNLTAYLSARPVEGG
jgi:hypothetical protein